MAVPLSILDLSPVSSGSTASDALRNSVALAQLADRLGYVRYWLAEHHNTPGIASSAPEILIGHLARETSRIRVGSGGIMLPNHAPLKVAETFRLLEALHPGRIDLGIGRAPGTDRVTAMALRRSPEALGAADFPEQLAELFAFVSGGFPDGHPFQRVTATPSDVPLPPVWLLGSSDYSARLAAANGLGFAFAHHINPAGAVAALRGYRDGFEPSAELPRPAAILTASVVCAETDAEAEHLASSLDLVLLRLRRGQFDRFPSPAEAAAYPYTPAEREQVLAFRGMRVVGDPATVRARLDALVDATGADEVMVTTMVHDHAARLRSFELLADAFGLGASPASERAA